MSGQTKGFVIEKRFIKKDRSIVWVRNSISLIPGAHGERLIIRVAEDVTAIKEADRLRSESEAKFTSLADSMPQIVWTADEKGQLDYFTRCGSTSGSNFEESVGGGWAKYVHPEDLQSTSENWMRSLLNSSNYENEFRLRSAKGEYRWFVARATPVAKEGTSLRWFGTNTDIHDFKTLSSDLVTARAHAESEKKKFEAIFSDAATAMAVLKGPDFVYEVANKSYMSLFNGRDFLGKPKRCIFRVDQQ